MKWVLGLLIAALIVIHQDLWAWPQAEPLVGGYMPEGLWYHALFCVLSSVMLAILVLVAWPAHLEGAEPETPEARLAEGYPEH